MIPNIYNSFQSPAMLFQRLAQCWRVKENEVIFRAQQNGIDEDVSTQEIEKWTSF